MVDNLYNAGLDNIVDSLYSFYGDTSNAPQWYSDPTTGQPISTVTPFQQAQIQGQNQNLAAADNYGAPLAQQYAGGVGAGLDTYNTGLGVLGGYAAGQGGVPQDVGSSYLNQNYLQGYQNPYLDQTANRIGQQAAAGANLAAGNAGVLGGARAARAASNAAAQATSPLYASAYDTAYSGAQQAGLQDAQLRQQQAQQNQQNQIGAAQNLANYGYNWAQQAPAAYQFSLAPGQTYQNIGAQQQAQGQGELNADINRFNYYQQLPQQLLNQQLGLYSLQQAQEQGQAGTAGNLFGQLGSLGSGGSGFDLGILGTFGGAGGGSGFGGNLFNAGSDFLGGLF